MIRLRPLDVAIYGAGVIVAVLSWAWALNSAAGDDQKDGPVRDVADIPPEIQAVLKQAPAPTHDKVTPWGLFVINPVIRGEALLNTQRSPIPQFDSLSAVRVESRSETGITLAEEKGLRVIRVAEAARKGLPLNGLIAESDGDQFNFGAYYGAGDGTPTYASLTIQAYTPRDPVPFEEFPDNAIWDFSKSTAVRGYPTLMVVPDKGTADPRDERVVAWSQENAVYWVKTTGLFTDDEVLDIAIGISASEELRK